MAATKKKRVPNPKGNPDWKKGMRSPNPKGRPKGVPDRRAMLNNAMLSDTAEIVQMVLQKAKDGDLQAASLVMSRVLPVLSSQTEKVVFDLDPTAPLAAQTQQVLKAISQGEVSADVGKQIIETIGALGSIRQMDEIEARLAKLEAV